MEKMKSIKHRLEKIFKSIGTEKLLIWNTGCIDSNFLYITGFTSGVFEDTPLIVERNGAKLITFALEYDIAVEQRPKELEVIKANDGKEFSKLLEHELYGNEIGINGAFLPYNLVKRIRKGGAKSIVDVSKGLLEARLVKDKGEIALMRKANRIAKKAFEQIPAYFKTGISEKELAAHFDYLMMRNGADGPSFPTIVSFGKNAALPHHMPDNTKLGENMFVLIDAGAKYKNYCSDLTRTFIFKPKKNSKRYIEMERIYETVKKAQLLALRSIKPGVEASTPHIVAENFINSAYNGIYRGRFIHSLGHSIGIDVHDGFGLSKGYKFKLKPGMVFSDEPGIYIKGFGGVRIEDDVLVTENGAVFF